MLERFKARGLVKARGKQRTDSTHVLAAVHDLHLLELVGETLRATLDDLAAAAPAWLLEVARPVWFERYGRRVMAAALNGRPRKTLDWRTPDEALDAMLQSVQVGVATSG